MNFNKTNGILLYQKKKSDDNDNAVQISVGNRLELTFFAGKFVIKNSHLLQKMLEYFFSKYFITVLSRM